MMDSGDRCKAMKVFSGFMACGQCRGVHPIMEIVQCSFSTHGGVEHHGHLAQAHDMGVGWEA